jgi:hypothetical protein
VLERLQIFHALDRAAIVTGSVNSGWLNFTFHCNNFLERAQMKKKQVASITENVVGQTSSPFPLYENLKYLCAIL